MQGPNDTQDTAWAMQYEEDDLTLQRSIAHYVGVYPQATVADLMAEFDLSDSEAFGILTDIRQAHYRDIRKQ